MLSSLYSQWEMSDDSALCCLLFPSIHLSRRLKGAFRVRELIQKKRIKGVNSIVPACNGKEQVLAVEERARQYSAKQILSSNCSTLLKYFLILFSCYVK